MEYTWSHKFRINRTYLKYFHVEVICGEQSLIKLEA